MGIFSANMPKKCMLQTPNPIATAPPYTQTRRAVKFGAAKTREASCNAVNEASVATT